MLPFSLHKHSSSTVLQNLPQILYIPRMLFNRFNVVCRWWSKAKCKQVSSVKIKPKCKYSKKDIRNAISPFWKTGQGEKQKTVLIVQRLWQGALKESLVLTQTQQLTERCVTGISTVLQNKSIQLSILTEISELWDDISMVTFIRCKMQLTSRQCSCRPFYILHSSAALPCCTWCWLVALISKCTLY